MNSIEILSSSVSQSLASEIAQELADEGFDTFTAEGWQFSTAGVATIGVVEGANEALFYSLGRRQGEGVPVFLVGDKMKDLPRGLRDVPAFAASDHRRAGKIASVLRSQLGWYLPPSSRDTDPEALLAWVLEDPSRLADIDPKSFSRVVASSLERHGFEVSSGAGQETDVLVLQSPELEVRGIVQCKTRPHGSSVSMRVLRDFYLKSCQSKADFACVVSNSRFTKSAEAWAAKCYPALHLWDLETLSSFVRPREGSRDLFTVKRDRRNKLGITEAAAPMARKKDSPGAFLVFEDEVEARRDFSRFKVSYDRCESSLSRASRWDYDLSILKTPRLPQRESEFVDGLLDRCNEKGISVRSIDVAAQEWLSQWRAALDKSRYVLLVLGDVRKDSFSSYEQALTLLADNWMPGDSLYEKYVVCAEQGPASKLILPHCLWTARFLDPGESRSIEAFVVDLERNRLS